MKRIRSLNSLWKRAASSRSWILISTRSHLRNRRQSNSRSSLCFYARLSIPLNPLTAFKLLYISLDGVFLPFVHVVANRSRIRLCSSYLHARITAGSFRWFHLRQIKLRAASRGIRDAYSSRTRIRIHRSWIHHVGRSIPTAQPRCKCISSINALNKQCTRVLCAIFVSIAGKITRYPLISELIFVVETSCKPNRKLRQISRALPDRSAVIPRLCRKFFKYFQI